MRGRRRTDSPHPDRGLWALFLLFTAAGGFIAWLLWELNT